MFRTILAVAAGIAAWVLLATLGGLIVRATWPEYVAVADAMNFTLPMLITRLVLSTITLLIAARLTAAVATGQVATWILGMVLVVVFIPIHASVWDKFPVWYHSYFLLTLIPWCVLGGRIGARRATPGPDVGPPTPAAAVDSRRP